jgi:hypothetical protein
MATPVEIGPGMRLAAPSRLRCSSWVSQARHRTTASIRVMWAAGQPKAVAPRRRKKRAGVPRETRGDVAKAADGMPADGLMFEPS